MSANVVTMPPRERAGNCPRAARGDVCLIAAESAIFIIFVVAYIFYIGKSLTGPTPSTFSKCRSSTRSVCFPAA